MTHEAVTALFGDIARANGNDLRVDEDVGLELQNIEYCDLLPVR